MKKTIRIVSVILSVCYLLNACSLKNTEKSDVKTSKTKSTEDIQSVELIADESDDEIYNRILESEHLELADALDQLAEAGELSGEAEDLYQILGQLNNCSGRFIQESEKTGNRYTADVVFYLSNGSIYCSIDYTGYMGTIADGSVVETQEPGYIFESFPKGDYYGREQDFRIYFSNESLFISWETLGDNICEYMLTRGDGSADSVQERHQTFEETGTLDTIREVIDKAFPDNPHNVIYDEQDMTVIVSVQIDEIRSALKTKDPDLLKKWGDLVVDIEELGNNLYSIASLPMYKEEGFYFPYVMYVHIYLVDSLNNTGIYSENEMLLWVENETVKYNVADEKSNSGNVDASFDNKDNSDYSNRAVTLGDLNALETAKNYLSVMAFSYSGLVEQLEFEGYSTSEATYAADNCGADWNQQAVKKAKEYLEVMSFSRQELIEQLEYEGFTHSQAVYGVDKVF